MTTAPTPSLSDFVALCGEAYPLIRQLGATLSLGVFPVPIPGGRISATRAAGRIRKLKRLAEELQRFESIEWAVRNIASSGSSANRPPLHGVGRDETQHLSPYDVILMLLGEWHCRNDTPAHQITLTTRNGRTEVADEELSDEEYCLASLSAEFDCLLGGTDRLSDLVDNGRELLDGSGGESARRAFRSDLRHLLLIHDREYQPIRHPKVAKPRAFFREKCRLYRKQFQAFADLVPISPPDKGDVVAVCPQDDTVAMREAVKTFFEELLAIDGLPVDVTVEYLAAVEEGGVAVKTCSPDVVRQAHQHCGSSGLEGINNGSYDRVLEVLGCKTLTDRWR